MNKIKLTKGKYALVDEEDFEFLSQWKWTVSNGYAVRSSKKEDGFAKRRHIRMHRVINNTPDELITDHINGDKLDNRKSNLRSASHTLNQQNKVKKPMWCRFRNKWKVVLRHSGGRYIKRFNGYEEALSHMKEKTMELQGIELRYE